MIPPNVPCKYFHIYNRFISARITISQITSLFYLNHFNNESCFFQFVLIRSLKFFVVCVCVCNYFALSFYGQFGAHFSKTISYRSQDVNCLTYICLLVHEQDSARTDLSSQIACICHLTYSPSSPVRQVKFNPILQIRKQTWGG